MLGFDIRKTSAAKASLRYDSASVVVDVERVWPLHESQLRWRRNEILNKPTR